MKRSNRVPLRLLEPPFFEEPDSCDGCGACCMTVGTPPALYSVYCSPNFLRWLADPASVPAPDAGYYATVAAGRDWAAWNATPEPLRAELSAYYAAYFAGTVPHRYDLSRPCLWFDEETLRCRNYEHRPEACREEVVLGDESCKGHRAEAFKRGDTRG